MTGFFEEPGKYLSITHNPQPCAHSNISTRFVWGSFTLASALTLVAGMSAKVATATEAGHTSKAISGLGIFAIFLFGWIFSFVYTPNQSLYCTEVLNQEIRAKGISLHALESNLATIFFTYTTSIALGDISWSNSPLSPVHSPLAAVSPSLYTS